MINFALNIDLLKQKIQKLPENCRLRISSQTQLLLKMIFDGLKEYHLSQDLDVGELFGRHIESYDGNHHIGLHILPVIPLDPIIIDASFKGGIGETGNKTD